ncbi:MAG: ATP-binding protein, partial [Bacteroidetes bacterium]|nr:ATP-binding protein [Bacteroidota bacterium]
KQHFFYRSEGVSLLRYIHKNYKENLLGTFVIPRTILDLLPEKLNNLIVGKRKKGIVKVLQQVEPSILDISIGTNLIIYCDTGLDQLIPINVMGDGIRRMLSLIVTIANMKNGCVFIDEIENGLHYKSLEILWRTVFEAAKEFNVQLFATTHSYECISAFQKAFAFNKHPQDPDEIRLFRIEKRPDEHLAHKMTNEMLETMLNDNWEVR